MDLTSNNLQWLICHKTKRNQTKPIKECDSRFKNILTTKCKSKIKTFISFRLKLDE